MTVWEAVRKKRFAPAPHGNPYGRKPLLLKPVSRAAVANTYFISKKYQENVTRIKI
jgi:hypothetical protein